MNKRQTLIILMGTLGCIALLVFSARNYRHTTSITASHGCSCCHHQYDKKEIADATVNHNAQPCTVIFDLNGVLFSINKKRAFSRLGFFDLVHYKLAGFAAHDLEDAMFKALHSLNKVPIVHSVHGDNLIPMHHSKELPLIMCQWFKGEISNQDVIEKLEKHVEELDNDGFFHNVTEKKLIKKSLAMFFDADLRCTLYSPIKKGVALLKECKRLGHTVYLLSNIDTELIELLKEKHPEIFDLFDGMVISGAIGMMKPHANIYQHTISKFKLDPNKCYFIDDQKENIVGAENAGINGILFDKDDHRPAYQALAELGVLPEKAERRAQKA